MKMLALQWMAIAKMCLVQALGLSSDSGSPDNYVSYQQGDFPLVISAPHGGYLRPASIPDRHNGCRINGTCVYRTNCGPTTSQCRATTVRDSNTREIAEALYTQIQQTTGKYPHLVINELHRIKMDANRDVDLATFGNQEALEAYGNYTLYIHQARTLIGLYHGGRGLFVDIHGQTHPEEWVELGYRINIDDLNSGHIPLETSSIRALGSRTCGDDSSCALDLISGGRSLGYFLEAEGYKVVPSPTYPSPGNGKYYRGGYNTETFGSKGCGEIDAIQIEMPRSIRFGDWEDFTGKLSNAILNFMMEHGYY